MRRFRVGRTYGIPIEVDLSLLLVLPLLVYAIATSVETSVALLNIAGARIDPTGLSMGATPWLLGVVAALGLFGGVLVHEFGHALVALRLGYGVDSISLWLFGGMARLSSLPDEAGDELAIAVAGPVGSVVVGIVAYAGFHLVPAGFEGIRFLLAYLAALNVFLAVFNMLPAFPMDGGRVLRALFAFQWSYPVATKRAADVGRTVAVLLGIFGLYIGSLIGVGLAIFLYLAASSETHRVTTRAALTGIPVREVTTPTVPSDDSAPTVEADTDALVALQRMRDLDVTRLVVVDDGRPIGDVTQTDLVSILDAAWRR